MKVTTVWAFPVHWPDPQPERAGRSRIVLRGWRLPDPTNHQKALANRLFLQLMDEGELCVDLATQENTRANLRARLRMNFCAARLHYETGPKQCRFYLQPPT